MRSRAFSRIRNRPIGTAHIRRCWTRIRSSSRRCTCAARSFRQNSEEAQWALIRDFLSMLVFATGKLRELFEQRGEVDFTEVARAAIQALGPDEAPTDLSYRLDFRIDHLLVDEFQDTSVSQYELVKALTREWSQGDNRTLFVVGDPMQSIYGFRQAEVGLFMEAAEREVSAGSP